MPALPHAPTTPMGLGFAYVGVLLLLCGCLIAVDQSQRQTFGLIECDLIHKVNRKQAKRNRNQRLADEEHQGEVHRQVRHHKLGGPVRPINIAGHRAHLHKRSLRVNNTKRQAVNTARIAVILSETKDPGCCGEDLDPSLC